MSQFHEKFAGMVVGPEGLSSVANVEAPRSEDVLDYDAARAAAVVLYRAPSGRLWVLKNRFGPPGLVVEREEALNLLEEKEKRH